MAVLPRFFLLYAVALCSVCGGVARGYPDMTALEGDCNLFTYPPGDPFGDSVAHLLEDLVTVIPNRDYYDYYTSSSYLTSVAYGHALCNTLLENSDCAICLEAAKSRVLSDCQEKIGAKYMLRDCMIRYENYQFSD